MRNISLKFLPLVLLILCPVFSSFQSVSEDVAHLSSFRRADVDSLPRRCRVIKRYRPKGEVYRIAVDVPNHANYTNATAEVVFEKKEGQAPLSHTTILLNTVRSKGKDGKDIELESDEFDFDGSSDNQTYRFTLKLYDNSKKLIETVRYDLTFKAGSKEPQTVFAVQVQEVKIERMSVEAQGKELPKAGTLNFSIDVKNDAAKEVGGVKITVLKMQGIVIKPESVVAKFAKTDAKSQTSTFTATNLMNFEGNLKGALGSIEFTLLDQKGNVFKNGTNLTVKEVKELADILKED